MILNLGSLVDVLIKFRAQGLSERPLTSAQFSPIPNDLDIATYNRF